MKILNIKLKTKICLLISIFVSIMLGTVFILLQTLIGSTLTKVATDNRIHTDTLLKQTIEQEKSRLSILAKMISEQSGTKSVIQADFTTISEYTNQVASQSGIDWIVITDLNERIIGKSKTSPAKISSTVISSALKNKPWSGIDFQNPSISIVSSNPITIGRNLLATVIVGQDCKKNILKLVGESTGTILSFGDSINGNIISNSTAKWSNTIQTADRNSKLYLNAELDLKKVISSFNTLRYSLIVLLFVSGFCTILLALFIANLLTKPLEHILKSVIILQHGSWPLPFNTSRKDEIGILENSLDAMTSELQSNHRRLSSMLQIDPLTELLNHRVFKERLEEHINSTKTPFGILIINIDSFAEYNRNNGPEAADKSLKEIARILSILLAKTDFCGRNSGDEFICCISDVQLDDIADKIKTEIALNMQLTVSIGGASFSKDLDTSDLLILACQLAVRQSKIAGKNRSQILYEIPKNVNEKDIEQILSKGSYSAVRALAEAVDAKDEYTRGHSRRVAEYARDLAIHMDYDSGFVELVFITGTLHDVGKIGVPDLALKKAGKLTEEEFETIKLHPALGEKIVAQIPELAATLSGIRSHHERFDGKGYPDSLAGNEISLLARILSIADTYDAMTSDRPYRKGLDKEYALSEIARGAGTQFDPELALSFVDMMSMNSLKIAA
jgi:diguanylate cyclase (GGDEF)-like protein